MGPGRELEYCRFHGKTSRVQQWTVEERRTSSAKTTGPGSRRARETPSGVLLKLESAPTPQNHPIMIRKPNDEFGQKQLASSGDGFGATSLGSESLFALESTSLGRRAFPRGPAERTDDRRACTRLRRRSARFPAFAELLSAEIAAWASLL